MGANIERAAAKRNVAVNARELSAAAQASSGLSTRHSPDTGSRHLSTTVEPMRWKRAAALAATGALATASVGFAQVQNRYQVASDPNAKGYARSLQIVITSPPDYVLDYAGRLGNDAQWKGPRYQATLRASLGGESGLGWSAGIYRTPSNRQTIIDNLVQDWTPVAEGTVQIERTVGGRNVGTLMGTWVLTQGSVMAGQARFELGLVFPLCGRTAYLGISALTPASDSAGGSMGFGEYRMTNGTLPSAWNRQQVLLTAQEVSVEGSLPAGRVSARATRRRVAGVATDCNSHPVAAVAVRLERQSGRRWVRATAGKTTATGTFSLSVRAAGTYRAVVGSRRSAQVRVG